MTLHAHKVLFRMKLLKIVVTVCGVFISSNTAVVFAEEIYKSVGKGGVIEYSTVPPDSGTAVETLTIPPEPSEADIRAAQQRLKELRDDLEEQQQLRAESDEQGAEGLDESGTEGTNNPPLNPNPFPALAPFLSVATVTQ